MKVLRKLGTWLVPLQLVIGPVAQVHAADPQHHHARPPTSTAAEKKAKPKSPAHVAKIKISFDYKNFPLKILTFDVRESEKFSIGKTQNISALTKAEPTYTKPINDSFTLKAGEHKTFVLVVENMTDKDEYFLASPHMALPSEASLGHFFECLCNHTVFVVKARSRWSRIVRLELDEDYAFPSLELRHPVLGISEQDANTIHKNRLFK